MPTIEFRHEIDCDEDTYWWRVCFDETFNKAMYIEHMKFPEWTQLEQKDEADKLIRKVRVTPDTGDLPAAVRKVIGDRLAYTEQGTFNKKTKRYTFTVVPSTLADKTTVKGEMWAEKLGDKKIRRMCRIEVAVKIFMVGSMVEDRIVQDLRASYDKGSAFTNSYIASHGL